MAVDFVLLETMGFMLDGALRIVSILLRWTVLGFISGMLEDVVLSVKNVGFGILCRLRRLIVSSSLERCILRLEDGPWEVALLVFGKVWFPVSI